jgi:hypothetical protein
VAVGFGHWDAVGGWAEMGKSLVYLGLSGVCVTLKHRGGGGEFGREGVEICGGTRTPRPTRAV